MCGECGHDIRAHGDRAVWPACEATWDHPTLRRIEDGYEWTDMNRHLAPLDAACECRGFR